MNLEKQLVDIVKQIQEERALADKRIKQLYDLIAAGGGAHAATHHSGGGDEVNHNLLLNYAANRHFLQSEITELGTIATGVWNGSDIDKQYITCTAAVRAYLNSNQENMPHATWTKIGLDAEDYDLGNDFDIVTSHGFTVPITGYYFVTGAILYYNIVADKRYFAAIFVDSAQKASGVPHSSHTNYASSQVSDVLSLTQNEVVYLYGYHDAGVGTIDVAGDPNYTYFTIHLIST